MAKFKIIQYLDKCIGCGACVSVCPAYFAMDEEIMKAKLKGAKKEGEASTLEVAELKGADQAADACAVEAIKIEKKK